MTSIPILQASPPSSRVDEVVARANWIRRRSLQMTFDAKQGHPGGDLSSADILAALYFGVMNYDAALPDWPQRDRFVMSKGHCTGALYSTLAAAGFIPEAELATYLKPLSRLNGHPNRNYTAGVETNTGPLGHGMPVAVGMAIASTLGPHAFHTFVLTGDGELQEGSIWEAAMTAGHRKLGNLTVVVDRNRLQQGAPTEETAALEPLGDKWRAFGWDVSQIDGHDVPSLLEALTPRPDRVRPHCIIADTIKGKGVSFMENQAGWHHGCPTADQFALAMKELGA